jgi:hypothetical protein
MTSLVHQGPFVDIFASPTLTATVTALQVGDLFLDQEPNHFPISYSPPTESASYPIILENLPWFQFQEFIESRGTFNLTVATI